MIVVKFLLGTLAGDAVCESFTITKTINIIQKLNSIDLAQTRVFVVMKTGLL